MNVGVLSRVLKSCGRWRALADHVRNLPDRQHPVGRALTAEERKRLFQAAASSPEWEHVYCAAVVAANTSMRPVEVKHLRRCDVDLVKRLVHVRRSKNETSHRVIPLNASASKPRHALRGVNYFCRSATTISAGEGSAKRGPLATAAGLGYVSRAGRGRPMRSL